ncbi:hypothetical protein V491_07959 [Pseudogymnoascus sp. VKM F-3775]|nr:hypothetical protein V491_07959 [Pseudogymnoascus sp. VKM F-3775]
MYYTGGEKIDLVSSDDENKGEKRTKRKHNEVDPPAKVFTTQEASDDETLKDLQMDAHKRREIIKDSPFSDEFMDNIDTDEFG